MAADIQLPVKGSPMRTQWGIDVTSAVNRFSVTSGRGLLARDGAGGMGYASMMPNMREKRKATSKTVDHPFQVRRIIEEAEVEGDEPTVRYTVFLPADCVRVNNTALDITADLESVEGTPGWYYLDGLAATGGVVSLSVEQAQDGDITGSLEVTGLAAEDDGGVDPNAPAEDDSSAETLLDVTVAEITEEAILQSLMSAVILEIPVADNVSIDRNGGDEGDDGSILQIAHFNDSEKNSGRGLAVYLAPLLMADPESGVITTSGTSSTGGAGGGADAGDDSEAPMLLARHNGQIIYIPLSAKNEEEPPPEEEDGCCEPHPEGGDAVKPDEEEQLGGFGANPEVGIPADSLPQIGGEAVQDCCSEDQKNS